MKIPAHKIPTRKEWRKIRDAAGGKSGMTKAKLGPTLDKFHKEYAKAQKKGEPADLVKSLNELQKEIDAYIKGVTSQSKPVAAAATKQIKKPTEDLVKKLTALVTAQHKALNEQSARLNNMFSMVEKGSKQIIKEAEKYDKILDPLATKFRRGVPEESKATLKQALEKIRKPVMGVFTASQDLNKERQDVITSADKPIQDAHKKEIKKSQDQVRDAMNAANSTLKTMADLIEKAK